MDASRVILLPGSVLPADLAYGALVTALGGDVEAVAKDLEVYRGDAPPPDYSLDTEVAGVLPREWGSFHLVSYSGGGAAALAFAAPAAGSTAQPGFARACVGRQLELECGAPEAVGEVRRARAIAGGAVHAGVHSAAGAI